MKKQLCSNALIILALIVGPLQMAFGQFEFIKGSIITSNHDTMYCYIMDQDLRENGTVSYKIKKDDAKIIRLKKADYLRVQMGRTVYEKLTVTDSTDLGTGYLLSVRILKLVSNGYVKLYSDIHNHGGSPIALYGKYESFHMRKGNESLVKINRIGYKDILKRQLMDMPGVDSKIEKIDFSEIPGLINTYNLWYLNK